MLDVWKQALEHLIHESSTAQQNDARQVMIVTRRLDHVGSIGELRQRYACVRTAVATPSHAELPSRSAALSRSQILDAAFGLRYLEIVTGRPLDVRGCRYLSWLLAAAA